jgi:hypothetical protein
MVYRYVPLLRGKAGEATALFQLTAAAKDRMFPILHLPAAVPPAFSTRIGHAWAGRRLGLDGLFNFDATGSGAAMVAVFNALVAAGVTVVPSVEYGAPLGYMNVVAPLAQAAGTGLVVKVRLGQLGTVVAWLAGGGWQPQSVDLVVVAGHIADFGAGVLDQLVVHSLQNLPQPQAWRSVTLAGSAAPKDMSNLGLGPNVVPRLDWHLWGAAHALPFQLDYGDHGIAHPDMTEPPGYVMGNATVSVKYAMDNDWLILKGRPVSGNNGIPMPTQYVGHAQALAGWAGFGGVAGCWGDARIGQIVGGHGTPGSRQTWVEIGVNRHLSLVADRLP